jgi:sulfate transport system substrate-binding protein
VTDVAQAFVDFLHTKEAKGYYTTTGYLRSTDSAKAAAGDPANGFPAIKDLFTVEDLGGWDALDQQLFSEDGVATQAKANAG